MNSELILMHFLLAFELRSGSQKAIGWKKYGKNMAENKSISYRSTQIYGKRILAKKYLSGKKKQSVFWNLFFLPSLMFIILIWKTAVVTFN